MNPIELVKRDLLDAGEWNTACQSWRDPIQELENQCPFVRHRVFVVRGGTGQFDFPTLPHGSYGYYAANGRLAVRLTRKNREIESVLADEWNYLSAADPVHLASLVLRFYDDGIKASHHVLKDVSSLRSFGNRNHAATHYELNEAEFGKAVAEIGTTQSTLSGQSLSLRAVTLCGWMHTKQNLGVESMTIAANGKVSFAPRHVLSRSIFSRVPSIMY